MRRLWLLCLTALLLTGCAGSGLPYAREMGDTALLRTMAVDVGRDGNVAVTVSTGERSWGLQGDEREDALVLSAERPSLSGACLAIRGQSDSYAFYGYVDQLLIGEGLAREGVLPVLRYFSEDGELGLGANVWLIRGGRAGDVLRAGGAEQRLTTLNTDGEQGAAPLARTAGDSLTALLEDGAACLPALYLVEREEEAALLEGGYGVVTPDGLAGFLEGEAAHAVRLLDSRAVDDVQELDLPFGRVVVRLTGAESMVDPVSTGAELTGLEILCRVEAEPVEGTRALTRAQVEQVTSALEERARGRIEECVRLLQRWGTDPLRLSRRAALAAPSLREVAARDRNENFSALTVTVRVEGRLRQR